MGNNVAIAPLEVNKNIIGALASVGEYSDSTPTIALIDSHLSKYKEKGFIIQIFELGMASSMFSLLFILFALMGVETYGRLRNHDARILRCLRKT